MKQNVNNVLPQTALDFFASVRFKWMAFLLQKDDEFAGVNIYIYFYWGVNISKTNFPHFLRHNKAQSLAPNRNHADCPVERGSLCFRSSIRLTNRFVLVLGEKRLFESKEFPVLNVERLPTVLRIGSFELELLRSSNLKAGKSISYKSVINWVVRLCIKPYEKANMTLFSH